MAPLLLLLLPAFALAKDQGCDGTPRYYAEKVSLMRARDLQVYVSKPPICALEDGVPSLACCARLCAELEFCVTAVFDSRRQNCAISYRRHHACNRHFNQTQSLASLEQDSGIFVIFCAQCQDRPEIRTGCEAGIQSKGINTRRTIPSRTQTSPIWQSSSTLARTDALTTSTLIPQTASTTSTLPVTTTPTTTTSTLPTSPVTIASTWAPATTEGRDASCFVPYPQQVLVGISSNDPPATFVIESGLTLAECQCFCASSWLSRRYSRQCESLQYYPDRAECFLNDRDHLSRRYDLANLVADAGTYYRFPCHKTELDITQYILGSCRGLLPPPSPNGPSNSPAVFSRGGPEMCFDVQRGYVLAGQSREIHHDMSEQECMCACASTSSFTCAAALYYARERECTLQMRNRVRRPDMFRRDESSYDIVYLGYTCTTEEEKAKFLAVHCPREPRRSASLVTGSDTDDCFYEAPNWTLRGPPSDIHAGISLQACKCQCLFSSHLREYECGSVQYDPETGTCLLARFSRHTLPRRFLKIEGKLMHKYFDFTCSNLNDVPQGVPEQRDFTSEAYAVEKCRNVGDFEIYGLAIAKAEARAEQYETNVWPSPRTHRNKISVFMPFKRGPKPTANPTTRTSVKIPYPPSLWNTMVKVPATPATEENSDEAELGRTKRGELRLPDLTIPLPPTPPTTSPAPTPKPPPPDANVIRFPTDEKRPKNATVIPGNPRAPAPYYVPTTSTTTTVRPFVALSQASFPTIGRCTYSAERNKRFVSTLVMDRVIVVDALSCVKFCSSIAECRSANFMQFDAFTFYCELNKDTPMFYSYSELPKHIKFNAHSVFFTGISCERLNPLLLGR